MNHPRFPAAAPVLAFGQCELDLQARQLRRSGQLEDMQPRVFDVLAHLVNERGRVVTKDELIRTVWGARVLSPSVVARALMLVRRHIGDDPDDPYMVRTVHGVGYQFVARVTVAEPVTDVAAAPSTAVTPPVEAASPPLLRLAVWRERAAAGDDALEHAERTFRLQLRELAREAGCSVVPLAAGDFDALPSPSLGPLMARHGVDRLLAYTLTAEGGSLWIDARIAAGDATVWLRSAREATPEALAQRLLGALSGRFPGWAPAVEAPATLDAFAGRTCARALELNAWQDWDAALRLFDVVRAMQPGLWVAEIGRLEALVGRRDADARHTARALLAQADAAGHAQAAAACRAALASIESRHAVPVPQPLLDAATSTDGDEELARLTLAATIEADADLFTADASQALVKAADDCARAGNTLRQASVLLHLGALQLLREELPLARSSLTRAVALQTARKAPLSRAQALAKLSLVLMRLGHVDEALAMVDQTLELLLPASRELPGLAYTPAILALTALEVGGVPRLRRIEALLAGADGELRDPAHPARRLARAALDAAEGRLPAARTALFEAVNAPPDGCEGVLRSLWWLEGLRLDPGSDGPDHGEHLMRLAGTTHAPALLAHAERALAARDLAAGRAGEALRRLLGAATVAPVGRTLATVRLDAAWLACEAGDPQRAQMLWRATAGYGLEHPLGLSVRARISAATGDLSAAARWQAQALALWGGATPAVQAALADQYGTGRTAAIAPLRTLASASWWCAADIPPT